MKLSIEDRILIYGLQPEKGTYELLASWLVLEPRIRFTEEETRKFDIKKIEGVAPDGQKQVMVAFNKEVAEGHVKEVKIPAKMSSYVAEELGKKDDKAELTIQLMPLYERFCLGKNLGELKKNVRNVNPVKQGKGDNQ